MEEEEHVAQKQTPENGVVRQGEPYGLDESGGQVIDLEIHHFNLFDDVGILRL